MKKSAALVFALLLSTSVFAKTVPSTQEQIKPSEIDQMIRLVDKRDEYSSQIKLSVIVTDHGMSTDVSPRHTVYLAFASLAEMGNISADFKIDDQAFRFLSATQKKPGVFEVKTIEYRNEQGLVTVTRTVDAQKVFLDEMNLRKKCGGDFCDQNLETSVEVQESTQPAKF